MNSRGIERSDMGGLSSLHGQIELRAHQSQSVDSLTRNPTRRMKHNAMGKAATDRKSSGSEGRLLAASPGSLPTQFNIIYIMRSVRGEALGGPVSIELTTTQVGLSQ
jgi:hypothetical protein